MAAAASSVGSHLASATFAGRIWETPEWETLRKEKDTMDREHLADLLEVRWRVR